MGRWSRWGVGLVCVCSPVWPQPPKSASGQLGLRVARLSYSHLPGDEPLYNRGGYLDWDFWEHGGLRLSVDATPFQSVGGRVAEERITSFAGRYYLPFNAYYGKLAMSVAQVRSRYEGAVNLYPMVANEVRFGYLNQVNPAETTLTCDIGYTRSTHASPQRLQVSQWALNIGLGFNHGMDWGTVGATRISPRVPSRRLLKPNHHMFSATWTHAFSWRAGWKPKRLDVAVRSGHSVFEVDSYAGSADGQGHWLKGQWSLGLEWEVGEHYSCMVHAGQASYRSQEAERYLDYGKTFLSLALAYRW